MKLLIAYGSKTGTARDCAKMLADKLGTHTVQLCDLSRETPNLNDFDFAVIGGSVRMGNMHKAVAEFVKSNGEALSNMKTAYFVCCADSEQFDYYAEKAIPASLLNKAVSFMCFGGELRPERHRGIEKLFVKAMRRSIINSVTNAEATEEEKRTMPAIIPENVSIMADAIKDTIHL